MATKLRLKPFGFGLAVVVYGVYTAQRCASCCRYVHTKRHQRVRHRVLKQQYIRRSRINMHNTSRHTAAVAMCAAINREPSSQTSRHSFDGDAKRRTRFGVREERESVLSVVGLRPTKSYAASLHYAE